MLLRVLQSADTDELNRLMNETQVLTQVIPFEAKFSFEYLLRFRSGIRFVKIRLVRKLREKEHSA